MANETEARIKSVIENSIRPALKRNGGDIEFLGYENGIVKVNLKCAIIGCSCIDNSLKNEIERLLKNEIDDGIKCVELHKKPELHHA